VRQHLVAGIKPEDPRTRFVAVQDAAFSVRQYDPGNVPFEQHPIALSPPMRFF